MHLGEFAFKPALVPSLVTFLILPVLLALGFWQLDRARQKEALLTRFSARAELAYVPVAAVDLADTESLYRKVEVVGRYDSGHQILLDNQLREGQPGYHVFTPLRVQGVPQAILVNRGWVPLGASRQQLPDIAVTDTVVSLKGWVAQPANPGLRLSAPESAGPWPRVVQYVDYVQLAVALGYALAPAVVLLAPEEAGGYWRDWRPHFAGVGPERHQGYAVQWFALAVTLLVIYIVVNTRRGRPENA